MEATTTPMNCALLIFLSVSLSLFTPSSADLAFIQSLCKEGADVDLCVSTLSADEDSLSCTDIPCVARVAVEHALQNATDVRGQAQALVGTGMPSDVERALVACTAIYSTVIYHIDLSLMKLHDRDYDYGASTGDLVGAALAAEDCESQFAARPSPIAEWNEVFDSMLHIAREMVDYLHE